MTVPAKWVNLIKRLFGLRRGKWVILLTVEEDRCLYEVIAREGKLEH